MATSTNIVKLFRAISAVVFSGLGLLIAGITVFEILDPVGSKMANDSDPFGDPTISIPIVLTLFGISIAFFVISGLLFNRLDKNV